MIEVEEVAKRFGGVCALDAVSFEAADGRITGLLGPNGAGKSTCLRILSTVLGPDAGTARIGGLDVVRESLAVRRSIGVLPHSAGLYPQLTARENILYYGRLYGLRGRALAARADELISRLGLEPIAERKAAGFSQGERTRTALARALIHGPRHLLLDEATSGLDVMAARELREWLRELRDEGCCILLSSHVMQEVTALVDDLVIIVGGAVAASGTPAQLAARYGNDDLEEIFVEAVADARRTHGESGAEEPGLDTLQTTTGESSAERDGAREF
jgi:sodium transport system ATP-binding protein